MRNDLIPYLNLPHLTEFLDASPVPDLVAPTPDPAWIARLPLIDRELAGHFAGESRHMLGVMRAGVCVRAGDLHAAHTICQQIPTPHGSAWHAIIHRRDGDFSNSKYWWRQAGALPWPAALSREISNLFPALCPTGKYAPALFVDAVQSGGNEDVIKKLQRVQTLEWDALFGLCVASA